MSERRSTSSPKRRRSNSSGPIASSPTADARSGEVELTERGRLTRDKVLASARTVFERDGYLDTRVADIADEAGVAHGTFYTYFRSKEEVFHELARELLGTMLDGSTASAPPEEVLVLDQVRRANRSYLQGYRASAKLMGIVEQVATFDEAIRRIRQDRSDAFTHRSVAGIKTLQDAGLASPDLDPNYASIALTSMVSRFAYVWLVDGPDVGTHLEFEDAVEALSLLWVQALGVPRDAVAPHRASRTKPPKGSVRG